MSFLRKLGTFFTGGGYDAAESTSNRRSPRTRTASEDHIAKSKTRRTLTATARDIRRNFSILRWAIEKHLDFVVPHNFHPKTGDPAFDQTLSNFVKYVSTKERFDSAGRHNRDRWLRIGEAHRTLDGDVGGYKLLGGFLQGVEGDRIADPPRSQRGSLKWVNGVLVNRYGRATRYAIHQRKGRNLSFERAIDARKMLMLGYYDRFDQIRGISPITSAINELRDVYEGFDYALAREKVNQLFAFAITRESEDGFTDPEDDDGTEAAEKKPYEVDFGKGPVVLDMDSGEDAKFLSAMGTTDQSQKFWDSVIGVALKAIGIPFSFFREDFTNFFGSRAALMLYLKNVKQKRADIVEFLDQWLVWRITEGIRLREIVVPAGFDLEMAPCNSWKWIPDGVAWWNPAQEVKANIDAVDNYQRSRSEIRAEAYGDDWKTMMEIRCDEDEFLRSKNLPITVPKTSSFELVEAGNSED